jgi:hypothetical protein
MQLHPPEFAVELERRLLRGEHLTLRGPRGSGKSTLLRQVHSRLIAAGVPCAYSSLTTSLEDITRALERAYPGVATAQIPRRTARARLWAAADLRSGVLLLDHFAAVSNAMVFLLKRLHGKVAGVLTSVDIDAPRERSGSRRPSRYGAVPVRMPITPTRQLRRLLYALGGGLGLPPLACTVERRLLEAARGRPGWIVRCAELACEPRYWCEHGLLVSALCIDTEAAVRFRALEMLRPAAVAQGPRADYRTDSEHSPTAGGSAASGLITPKQAGV